MKKLVLFGASGFIGKKLFDHFNQTKLFNLVGTYNGSVEPKEKSALIKLDLLNQNQVHAFLSSSKPDIIINCTGNTKGNASVSVELNLLATMNILNAVVELIPATKLVFFGSAAEYGPGTPELELITETKECNPVSVYGIVKFATTLIILDYIKKHKLNATVIRPFNVIGGTMPPSLLIGALLQRIRDLNNIPEKQSLKVGNVNVYRDFIDIRDLCRFIQLTVSIDKAPPVLNACSGNPVKVEYVVEQLIRFSGKNIELCIDSDLLRGNDQPYAIGNNSAAALFLGFNVQHTIDESLLDIWKEYNAIK
jgi:nucleoside-diphosphate-sugar epimerase